MPQVSFSTTRTGNVSGRDESAPHLDFAHGIETVELVEQLKHGPLDLTLAAAVRIVTLGSDRINLVW